MEKKLSFNNTDELKELVKTISPVNEDDTFWTKSIQLCVYVFGVAALDLKGGNTIALSEVCSMLTKAYNTDAHKYLRLFSTSPKFSEEHRKMFSEFSSTADGIITGLVLCASLALKKYLQ